MIFSASKYSPAVKISKRFKWICLSSFFLLVLLFAFQLDGLSTSTNRNLQSYLTCIDELPKGNFFDGVYILGGNQESLKAKYKTVASIYSGGRCKEIIILSRPGITEYNNTLGRNLTNDEWSLKVLEGFGVSIKDIQTLKIERGFFGTYTEANWVSRVAEKNRWQNLLLITSPHHTKRVKKCFAHVLDGTAVHFWVMSSKYNVGFFELLSELFKLKFYQILLLR